MGRRKRSDLSEAELEQAMAEEKAAVEKSQPGHAKGRPRKKIDWAQIEYLASLGSTTGEIAAAVGIHRRSLEKGKRGRIFAAILERGTLKANVSIRRVLFGTLRGRLIDPVTGEVEMVPQEERIAMAKYLANRKTYLNLEEAAQEHTGNLHVAANVMVVRVGADEEDPEA